MGSIGGVFGSTQSGRKEAKPIRGVPWANWDGPGKEYDVPEVLEIQSIESSASGPGILAQFGEETTAWSEDAATPSSWMDAMMA